MRISDWSSAVCSSDLIDDAIVADGGSEGVDSDGSDLCRLHPRDRTGARGRRRVRAAADHPGDLFLSVGIAGGFGGAAACRQGAGAGRGRSEEHTSELQSLMRISYAVFCLKNKKITTYRQMIAS